MSHLIYFEKLLEKQNITSMSELKVINEFALHHCIMWLTCFERCSAAWFGCRFDDDCSFVCLSEAEQEATCHNCASSSTPPLRESSCARTQPRQLTRTGWHLARIVPSYPFVEHWWPSLAMDYRWGVFWLLFAPYWPVLLCLVCLSCLWSLISARCYAFALQSSWKAWSIFSLPCRCSFRSARQVDSCRCRICGPSRLSSNLVLSSDSFSLPWMFVFLTEGPEA